MPLSFTGPDSFFSADEEAWWAAVDKALKGMAREKLYSATEDGFQIAPLYAGRRDTPARQLRQDRHGWTISQRIDIPGPAQANRQILDDLEGGANGLELVFAGAAASGGLQVADLDGLETLLAGVLPNLIRIRVDGGSATWQAIALLLAHLDKIGTDPAAVAISAARDPFEFLARSHSSASGPHKEMEAAIDTALAAGDRRACVRALAADGIVWHSAGATPAQELGLVLASATAQMRTLEQTPFAPQDWAGQISFSLAADADQFGTIAKARALRALWSSVLDGAGLPQAPAYLHMTTSFRMLTQKDPWVNLLRNTVAVFAAGVGGADSVCVLPHTYAVGLPEGLARRLARNTQAILLEESSLAKVMDPAAGAGAVEDRTETLCAAAWEVFQEIEAAGGLAQAVRQGLVQTRLEAAKADLALKIATRKRAVTGVSEFPNLSEKPVAVLETGGSAGEGDGKPAPVNLPPPGKGAWTQALVAAALDGKAMPGLGQVAFGPKSVALDQHSLSPMRLAEPFETLRRSAKQLEEKTARRPVVFLASLGPLSQFTARATWTANAFAAGGLGSVEAAVYASLDDLVAAFQESGAVLACLVSSDAVYKDEAVPAARALKAAGAHHLYLAGRPGEQEAGWTAAGVDTFLYAGGDLLALLAEAQTSFARAHGLTPTDLEVPA